MYTYMQGAPCGQNAQVSSHMVVEVVALKRPNTSHYEIEDN